MLIPSQMQVFAPQRQFHVVTCRKKTAPRSSECFTYFLMPLLALLSWKALNFSEMCWCHHCCYFSSCGCEADLAACLQLDLYNLSDRAGHNKPRKAFFTWAYQHLLISSYLWIQMIFQVWQINIANNPFSFQIQYINSLCWPLTLTFYS